MPLEDVGKRAGVAPSTISELEFGDHDPTLGTLLRLQRALGLSSVEEFLGPVPAPPQMPSVAFTGEVLPDAEVAGDSAAS